MGCILRWRRRKVSETLFQLNRDPRETPIYDVAEVAAYLGVPRSTLRHWLKEPAKGRAIIEAADSEKQKLSFYNVLEAHILSVALKRNTWLQRVRTAVETLREQAPDSEHPLLRRELFTASGYRSIFAQTITGDIENLSSAGQLEFRPWLTKYLSRIDVDDTGPFQLRPYGYRHVALNHRVAGGRPVIRGTGILVTVIARRLRAGEKPEDLARNYQISKADVREAQRYAAA